MSSVQPSQRETDKNNICQYIKRYIFARAYSVLPFQKDLHIKKVKILSPAHTKKAEMIQTLLEAVYFII